MYGLESGNVSDVVSEKENKLKNVQFSISSFSKFIKNHYIALLFFLAVSIFWTIVSWDKRVEHLTTDLHIYLGIVLKEHDSSLFQKDFLFGDKENYLHFPPYTEFLKFFYKKTGDITYGLKVMTLPLNFIFMVGAYYFFTFITENRKVSAVLAFISSLPIEIPLSAEMFGIGPATIITPRVIFTAFFPLTIYLFYRAVRDKADPKMYAVFLIIGLLANIYPISGYLLAQILLITIFFNRGVNKRTIFLSIKCAFFSLIGVIPYLIFYLGSIKNRSFNMPIENVVEMFRWRIPYFYPQDILLSLMPEYLLHFVTLCLSILPPLILYLYRKTEKEIYGIYLFLLCFLSLAYMLYSSSNKYYLIFIAAIFLLARNKKIDRTDELSLYFGFAIFYAGILGVIINQLLYNIFNIPPFNIIHQLRAIRFSGFLVFLMLTICIKWLIADYKEMALFKKVVIVTLTVFVFFMSVRHDYRTYARAKQNYERDDLVKVSLWAKENTTNNALFVFDSALFRLLSERSVTIATKDIGMFFITKRNFAESYSRAMELKASEKNLSEIIRISKKYHADYVVLKKRNFLAINNELLIYQNSTYIVISPERISSNL